MTTENRYLLREEILLLKQKLYHVYDDLATLFNRNHSLEISHVEQKQQIFLYKQQFKFDRPSLERNVPSLFFRSFQRSTTISSTSSPRPRQTFNRRENQTVSQSTSRHACDCSAEQVGDEFIGNSKKDAFALMFQPLSSKSRHPDQIAADVLLLRDASQSDGTAFEYSSRYISIPSHSSDRSDETPAEISLRHADRSQRCHRSFQTPPNSKSVESRSVDSFAFVLVDDLRCRIALDHVVLVHISFAAARQTHDSVHEFTHIESSQPHRHDNQRHRNANASPLHVFPAESEREWTGIGSNLRFNIENVQLR